MCSSLKHLVIELQTDQDHGVHSPLARVQECMTGIITVERIGVTTREWWICPTFENIGGSRCKDGSFLPQRPEISTVRQCPDVVAGEADVLPAEWGNVL